MPRNGILIELSPAQINEVVRKATAEDALLGGVGGRLSGRTIHVPPSKMDDVRFSRSLLRALMVLSSFPADGSARSVSDVAQQLGMGISTAHRYTSTFAEVGVLERDPGSRRYRLAGASSSRP